MIWRANWLAKTINMFESRFAETTIGVAIIIESRCAIWAYSFNSYISRLTNTKSSDWAVELIDSWANICLAFLLIFIINIIFRAFRTSTLNDYESFCTITFTTVEVIYLIDTTLNSANSLVYVIELTIRAFSTEIIN